ncbi:MAG: endolytic transglycosylase MltG [Firmicutes bacterium]|nr:endolytic transglycosylase MltG [Bacillota bacterium]
MKAFLKIAGYSFLVIILMAIAFTAGIAVGAYYILTPVGGGEPVKLTITEGMPASEVAQILEETKVVKSAFLFRIVMKTTGADKQLKPGDYQVSPDQTMMEIVHLLKSGNLRQRLVSIPEGLTIPQIAAKLEEKGIVKKADFLGAVKSGTFNVNGNPTKNLEGYLMPETYDFPEEFKASDVILRMVKEFDTKAVPLYLENQKSLPYALSLAQVVTLASLIEREAQVPAERPVIASVYYNRLKKGMYLQCDATVQYALGENKPVLTYDDLKIDSPYNTYKNPGLPPGPIANPGLESIRAALQPEKTDYLYYVRNDVKNDGSHVFSRSLEEHNQAIQQYQK